MGLRFVQVLLAKYTERCVGNAWAPGPLVRVGPCSNSHAAVFVLDPLHEPTAGCKHGGVMPLYCKYGAWGGICPIGSGAEKCTPPPPPPWGHL